MEKRRGSGDQAYKDAVSIACMLRGIEVRNHVLLPKAGAVFDRLTTEQAKRPEKPSEFGSTSDHKREQRPGSSPASCSGRPSILDRQDARTNDTFSASSSKMRLPYARAGPAKRGGVGLIFAICDCPARIGHMSDAVSRRACLLR